MRNKVPVKSRDSSGSARHLQRRLGRRRSAFFFSFHALWRLKLSATRRWPARSLREVGGETVHLTVLTSVSFHLFTSGHLLLYRGLRCPAVRGLRLNPARWRILRGPQVNYIYQCCCVRMQLLFFLLFTLCMLGSFCFERSGFTAT